MDLPDAKELKTVLTAIKAAKLREAGITHVRFGALEIRIAPATPGQDIVEAINRSEPTPQVHGPRLVPFDPDANRRAGTKDAIDIVEALASGRPLMSTDEPVPNAG